MANTPNSSKDFNTEFLKAVKASQWRPVNARPAPTRETLRAELREHLIGKTGSETLADLAIVNLENQANARVRLEAELRQELARVDASIERFAEETPAILEPHERRLKAAQDEILAAAAAFEAARCARDSELARGLAARRREILAKLRGTDVIQGRMIPWREGGAAPQLSSEN